MALLHEEHGGGGGPLAVSAVIDRLGRDHRFPVGARGRALQRVGPNEVRVWRRLVGGEHMPLVGTDGTRVVSDRTGILAAPPA